MSEKDIEHIRKKIRTNSSLGKLNLEESYRRFYKEKDKKLRWDLAPWEAFEKVVEVITEGVKKYGEDNWKLINDKVFDAAMVRHYVSYKKGERYDDQWNLTHLSHLACNAIFLLWKETLIINIEKRGELKSTEASKNLKDGDN